MCSQLKFFVIALFFNAVAPDPYYVPKYDGRDSNIESGASYMSPIPTVKDTDEINDELLRHPRNLRSANIKKTDNHITQNISHNDGQGAFNYIEHVNPNPDNVEISPGNYENPSNIVSTGNKVLSHDDQSIKHNNDPISNSRIQHLNGRSDKIRRPNNIEHNQQALRVREAPKDRISFQSPLFNLPDLDSLHPAIPVNDFEHLNNVPLKIPVQNHDIQKIVADQRIQNVLSSTKQTKRYMVIHPNGRVEQVDNIELIASQFPNHVLVNSGHVNKKEMEVKKDQFEQVQVPTLNKVSSNSEIIISEPQLTVKVPALQPIISNPESVISEQELLKQPVNEKVQIKEPPINVVVKKPLAIVSTIKKTTLSNKSFSTPKSDISSTSSDDLSTTLQPNNASKSAEITQDLEQAPTVQISDINKESVPISTTTLDTIIDDNKTNVVESSSVIPESTNVNINAQEVDPVENSEALTENVNITQEAAALANSEAITENVNSIQEVVPVVDTEEITEPILNTTSENVTDCDNNTEIEATLNAENVNDLVSDGEKESELSRYGKPSMWFNTSDPNYLQKLKNFKDENIVYFFIVKPSPRIEKDTQKTVYPDGSILEEITETVYDGNGLQEPKITKTSRLIKPDKSSGGT